VKCRCGLTASKALQGKMKLSMAGVTVETYKKLNSGESFLRLKEFQEEMLEPVQETFFLRAEDMEYLLSTLLAFVCMALEKKLTIEIATEDLLLRLFLRTRKFLLLHQSVQNSIFTDRLPLALMLCELGSKVKRPAQEDRYSDSICYRYGRLLLHACLPDRNRYATQNK
jgi:hypothetical protein